jgi:amidase
MRTRAQFDCEAVVRLRAAGAVIIAKTTLPELAAFTHFTASKTFGTTRNPWDLTRSPGGSSGGSAVSVAAGYVGAALASDGGGSIRVPAACCGLVGLKPQRGRVPLAPHTHHWYGMGVLGPIARRVEDVALLLDVLTTSTGLVPSTQFGDAVRRDPSPHRIAFSLRPAVSTRVSSEVSRAVRETARLLESAGHRVEERDPDYGDVRSLAVPRYLRGIAADKQLLDRPDELEARTQTLVRLSRMISNSRLTRSHAKAPEYTTRINTLFDDYDVLLTPVIAKAAPSAEHWAQRGGVANLIGGVPWIAFTQVWNLTGQPALSLPAGFDSDGMPSAVQLIGPPESEALLLCLAAQLQSAAPWSDRRPPLPPVA